MSENNLFSENPNVDIEVKKVVKKKRQLTEKQLENLRLGREKMKQKRAEKKKMLQNEKKAVKENVKIHKEQKKEKKKNRKTSEQATKHKEELLRKKKEEEIKKVHAEKLGRFDDMKSKWLLKTNTIEDYETVEKELDTIPEEVIVDDEKLETTLLDLVKKYKGENFGE